MVADREGQKKVHAILEKAEDEYKKRKDQLGHISQTKVKLDDTYGVVKLMKDADNGIRLKYVLLFPIACIYFKKGP